MNLRRVWGVMLKYVYVMRRFPERWADMLYWPILTLLFWWFTSSFLTEEVSVRTMILGAVVFWAVFARSQQEISQFLLQDVHGWVGVNLFASPLRISELLTGTIIFGTVRALVIASLMVFVSSFVFHTSLLQGFVLVPLMMALLLFGSAIAIIISGVFLRLGGKVRALSWAVALGLQPFSAVTYPVAALPLVLQKVSWVLPTTYVFEGFRAVVSGEPFFSLAVFGFGLSVFYFFLSLGLFSFFFRRVLKNGLLLR